LQEDFVLAHFSKKFYTMDLPLWGGREAFKAEASEFTSLTWGTESPCSEAVSVSISSEASLREEHDSKLL